MDLSKELQTTIDNFAHEKVRLIKSMPEDLEEDMRNKSALTTQLLELCCRPDLFSKDTVRQIIEDGELHIKIYQINDVLAARSDVKIQKPHKEVIKRILDRIQYLIDNPFADNENRKSFHESQLEANLSEIRVNSRNLDRLIMLNGDEPEESINLNGLVRVIQETSKKQPESYEKELAINALKCMCMCSNLVSPEESGKAIIETLDAIGEKKTLRIFKGIPDAAQNEIIKNGLKTLQDLIDSQSTDNQRTQNGDSSQLETTLGRIEKMSHGLDELIKGAKRESLESINLKGLFQLVKEQPEGYEKKLAKRTLINMCKCSNIVSADHVKEIVNEMLTNKKIGVQSSEVVRISEDRPDVSIGLVQDAINEYVSAYQDSTYEEYNKFTDKVFETIRIEEDFRSRGGEIPEVNVDGLITLIKLMPNTSLRADIAENVSTQDKRSLLESTLVDLCKASTIFGGEKAGTTDLVSVEKVAEIIRDEEIGLEDDAIKYILGSRPDVKSHLDELNLANTTIVAMTKEAGILSTTEDTLEDMSELEKNPEVEKTIEE